MSYTEQTWNNGVSGNTPVSADRLRHMEAGIKDASDRLDVHDDQLVSKPVALAMILGE